MTGLGDIFKQAQEMQSKLAQMQEDLGKREVEASSGGGMVTAVANGRQEILRIRIEPAVFESADKEMLEDLVTAAVNAALSQAKTMLESEMTRLAGGLNIPGLFGGAPGRGPMGYGA
ncbi:MAG: YbaB/EbfC family nucleoid-associated protein [Desulfovibrionaceae bacterium]|nr:YbaB/EbfC family nucleoid-associated protein [Desulfovibrionaceae bacterium]